MKNIHHYTIIPAFLFFMMSCNETKRKVVEKWENGKDKLVYEFSSTSDTLNFKKLFYYSDGLIRYEENYNNGIINGAASHMDSNGTISSVDFYQNGFRKEFKEYYNATLIKRQGVFQKLDTIDTFDSTGVLLKRVVKNIGEITEYYLNGKPKNKIVISPGGKEELFEWSDSL